MVGAVAHRDRHADLVAHDPRGARRDRQRQRQRDRDVEAGDRRRSLIGNGDQQHLPGGLAVGQGNGEPHVPALVGAHRRQPGGGAKVDAPQPLPGSSTPRARPRAPEPALPRAIALATLVVSELAAGEPLEDLGPSVHGLLANAHVPARIDDPILLHGARVGGARRQHPLERIADVVGGAEATVGARREQPVPGDHRQERHARAGRADEGQIVRPGIQQIGCLQHLVAHETPQHRVRIAQHRLVGAQLAPVEVGAHLGQHVQQLEARDPARDVVVADLPIDRHQVGEAPGLAPRRRRRV